MIVVVKNKKGYTIGCDATINLDGYRDTNYIIENDRLFYDADGTNTIIGVPDSTKYANFIRGLTGLLPPANKTLTMEYMVNTFVPTLYNHLVNMRYAEEDAFPSFDAEIVVIRKDKGFIVSNDASVMRIGTEDVIGEKSDVGTGYLKVLPNTNDSELKIMKVFNLTSKICPMISSAILIANSDRKEQEIDLYDEPGVEKCIKEEGEKYKIYS